MILSGCMCIRLHEGELVVARVQNFKLGLSQLGRQSTWYLGQISAHPVSSLLRHLHILLVEIPLKRGTWCIFLYPIYEYNYVGI